MKQFILACILLFCLNSCTYGQERIISSGEVPRPPSGRRANDLARAKVDYTLQAIQQLYVDTINNTKLAEDAIIALLEKLDPHSAYMTAEEVKEANEPLQGNFDGIGIQFNMLTDTLYVVQVIAGGPSEKIGILAGDKIILVDDTLIAGVKMKNTDVMAKLKGPKGTIVNVKILRQGVKELIDFKIIRDKIPVYSISASYMVDDKTGYIKLIRFARTTIQEFRKALGELQEQGMKNLILDLQDNGGGYLEASVELANELLKAGSLIVYTEGLNQKREDFRSTNGGAFNNGRLVILVDEYSASASEIVSGAVQDWDRGVIVGRRTFGKGLVQRPIPLPDGSLIRLTTAHYYTPTGRSIQKPYVQGDKESYNKELINRYNRGEMISEDSIHFPDMLKYTTLTSNRTVYGGGGIMPDYFIPFDTTSTLIAAGSTSLYREIGNLGIPYKYVRAVIEANRNKYKEQYPLFDSFKKNFIVSDNMLNDMLNIYKKDKAEGLKLVEIGKTKELPSGINMIATEIIQDPNLKDQTFQLTEQHLKDLEISKSLLSQQIKMLIAREIYGDNEFFQLWNPLFSDSYNKAIEIISNENEYNKLLQGRK